MARTTRTRLMLALAAAAVAAVSAVSAIAATTPTARQPFPARAVADYQIGGAYPPPPGVEIVDRDSSARPVPGLYNICYVNAYHAQQDQVTWWRHRHPGLLLRTRGGRLIIDPDWGEPLLDTSTPAKRAALAAIIGGWFRGCGAKGFAAVEPDNLDSFLRSHGELTLADNLAYARLLAGQAHAAGLDIAQKNLAENSRQVHALGFDFAIAEQCEQYQECGQYTRVYGHAVIDVEYAAGPYRSACRADAGDFSIELRDLDVVPAGTRGYRYAHC